MNWFYHEHQTKRTCKKQISRKVNKNKSKKQTEYKQSRAQIKQTNDTNQTNPIFTEQTNNNKNANDMRVNQTDIAEKIIACEFQNTKREKETKRRERTAEKLIGKAPCRERP